jgi:alkaline phosphatase D
MFFFIFFYFFLTMTLSFRSFFCTLCALCLLLTAYQEGQAQPNKLINASFAAINKTANDTLIFQTGSCALQHIFNQRAFKIFKTMENSKADFMIWLGDHVYFIGKSKWGSGKNMRCGYKKQRKNKHLASFLKSKPQYALWDDHEFGPNDSGADFPLRDTSLAVFKEHWNNPSYGLPDAPGVFFTFKQADAQFFMTDGRYNAVKWTHMFGDKQMTWLKQNLKTSNANFKFICMGSQALCEGGRENLRKYKQEFEELTKFIADNHITGVLFISGDRHFSCLTKMDRPGTYPLYDITTSSLTSPYLPHGLDNTLEVPNTRFKDRNFGNFTIYGPPNNRTLQVQFVGAKGNILWQKTFNANDLK